MTVHLISVGLSLRDAFRHPHEKFDDPDLAELIDLHKPFGLLPEDMDRDAANEWLAGALAAAGEPGHNAAEADRLRDLSAAIRPGKWPRTISAEIETLDRVDGTDFPLSPQDMAILICSDTKLGLLAGVWNALALTDGDLTRIRYLPEPGSLRSPVRGCTVLARIRGMDAGSSEGFRQAMGGLGLLAHHLFQYGKLDKAEEFRFYLSGGFKAAIPYLIGLAEAVRSVDGKCLRELCPEGPVPDKWPYPVEAFVLHETARPEAPAIRLPLRMLVAAAVRAELAVFGADGTFRGELQRDRLLGYAYQPEGAGCYKLTAFGAGLRALFSTAHAPEGFLG
jgi:hypothetical protein